MYLRAMIFIFISFVVILLLFLVFFLLLRSVVEMGAFMVVHVGWFGHSCVHLDTESTEHRQRPVERLKSFAGLDAGQTGPIEAELELVDELLLGEPVHGARVAQHSAEIATRPNPILLCAHINTYYISNRLCQ